MAASCTQRVKQVCTVQVLIMPAHNIAGTFTCKQTQGFTWEGVSNLDNLHTNLAVSNIGQGSLTPLKYRVQSWVQIFIAVQS